MKKLITLLIINLFIGVNFGLAQSNCVQELSTITDNPTVFGIGVKDHYLYANPGLSKIKIYDISNPENPIPAGQVNFAGNFTEDLDILGNHLYLFGGPDNNFIIFDISNATSPIELGRLQLPDSDNGIWHSDHLINHTYLTSKDTIYVINTMNKSNPFIENKVVYSEPGIFGLRKIYATPEFLYIGIKEGILIYDNSTPSLPIFQSIYTSGRFSMVVDINSNLLYSLPESGSDYNHSVSNIEDPFNPDLLFEGSGGSSRSSKLLVHNGILIQVGRENSDYDQEVSFYKIQGNSTTFIENFLGSVGFNVTDMDAVDSLFIISKNGGIEILKYNDCFTSSVDRTMQNKTIKLHPNPFHDILTLIFEDEFEGMRIEIIDGLGRTILNKSVQDKNEKIDLHELNQGLYFVKFDFDGKHIMTKKILKN